MISHIGFIMDGNRRWALRNNVSLYEAYFSGFKVLQAVINEAISFSVQYITAYTLSHENLGRSEYEKSCVIELLHVVLTDYLDELNDKGVCLSFLGDLSVFDARTNEIINHAVHSTRNNKVISLGIALNYNGQQEILKACKQLIATDPSTIDIHTFEQCLYMPYAPSLDLVIRTSGAQRISNFMLWRIAYAELFFSQNLWPDFTVQEFSDIVAAFYELKRTKGL